MNAFTHVTLQDAAISLGTPVFPCNAAKEPLTRFGFKDATTDPNEIRRAFSRLNVAMIGRPTGDVSGILVVDVDIKNGKRGMDWLTANADKLPETRSHITESGGLHLVFKMPAIHIGCSKDRLHDGIDIRANGGYVIVPPSPGYSIHDYAEPAEMPAWLIDACLAPKAYEPSEPMPRHEIVRQSDGRGSAYGLKALDEECQRIMNAGFGSQEDTLNSAGLKIGGLVAGGQIEEGEALGALLSASRGVPSQPGKTPWTISKLEDKIRRAFRDGKRTPRGPDEAVSNLGDVQYYAGPLLEKIHAKAAQRTSKPIPVAPSLMDVGGALQLWLDYVERTALYPQPFLALAAGICAVGVLAGRRYRTATNLRTNVYAVGVAGSSGGKDHARKKVKAVFGSAGLTAYLGGEDVASGAAIFTALSRHPASLFQIDEMGDWLNDILGKKAPAHKKQIAQKLKTLYSSADSFISGTEYANQSNRDGGRPREDIQQPHACFYGTTTPEQFWAAVKEGSLYDGLLARFLLFVSPVSYPDENEDPEDIDPPEELVAAFQAIAAGVPVAAGNLQGPITSSSMMAGVAPTPHRVPETPEAAAMIRALRKEQVKDQRKHDGTYVTSINGRTAENAVKLALIRAVSRDPLAPILTEADVAWGRAISQHCANTLLREASQNVSESEFETKMNKVLSILRKHGSATARDLFRRGFKLPERERNDVLRTLVDSGLVMAVEVHPEGAGRPTVKYTAMVDSIPKLGMGDDDE